MRGSFSIIRHATRGLPLKPRLMTETRSLPYPLGPCPRVTRRSNGAGCIDLTEKEGEVGEAEEEEEEEEADVDDPNASGAARVAEAAAAGGVSSTTSSQCRSCLHA